MEIRSGWHEIAAKFFQNAVVGNRLANHGWKVAWLRMLGRNPPASQRMGSWRVLEATSAQLRPFGATDFLFRKLSLGIECNRSRFPPIHIEHNRAPRYPFVASFELWELDSDKHLSAHIKNLNLLGCYVETVTPWPEGTKLRLSVTRGSMNFVAIGRVAYSKPNSGMGVAFVTIESASMPVLDGWLEKLRG